MLLYPHQRKVYNMNEKGEKTLIKEYYDNPKDFLDELNQIPVRKLVEVRDKKLVQKLKRWVREYWKDDGTMEFYPSQARRIKEMLADIGIESKIKGE